MGQAACCRNGPIFHMPALRLQPRASFWFIVTQMQPPGLLENPSISSVATPHVHHLKQSMQISRPCNKTEACRASNSIEVCGCRAHHSGSSIARFALTMGAAAAEPARARANSETTCSGICSPYHCQHPAACCRGDLIDTSKLSLSIKQVPSNSAMHVSA